MPETSTAAAPRIAPFRPDLETRFGDRPPGERPAPPVSNGRLAVVLFMGTESMLFAGLIGAFTVFRYASPAWPPPNQPYLPIVVTWLNTGVLFMSAWTMQQSMSAVRTGDERALQRFLSLTAMLGSLFLLIQGAEWVRLIRHGLTLSSSTYGATFYMLIGLHGAHVLGAVAWLLGVLAASRRGRYTAARHEGVALCSLYWYYVCGLWGLLFYLVYLR